MSTFCNPWGYHILKTFHTNRTLNILCIDHVENNLNHISPLDWLIRIEEIEQVIFITLCGCMQNKFECRLHTVIFHQSAKPCVLPATLFVSVHTIDIFFFIIVGETEKKVCILCRTCYCCRTLYLRRHWFIQMQFLFYGQFSTKIIILKRRLTLCSSSIALSFLFLCLLLLRLNARNLHTVWLSKLMMLIWHFKLLPSFHLTTRFYNLIGGSNY